MGGGVTGETSPGTAWDRGTPKGRVGGEPPGSALTGGGKGVPPPTPGLFRGGWTRVGAHLGAGVLVSRRLGPPGAQLLPASVSLVERGGYLPPQTAGTGRFRPY